MKKVKQNKKKPLERHKTVLKGLSENIGKGKNTMTAKMIEQGYSESYAKSGHIKETRSWDVLLQEEMSDGELMTVHKSLLNSHRLDHMVFPPLSTTIKKGKLIKDASPEEKITDEEIGIFFSELGCKLRKIVHGEQARHVYFWSPDNQARDKALDKGYKLKNKYAPEEYNLKFKGFSKDQLIDSIMNKISSKK